MKTITCPHRTVTVDEGGMMVDGNMTQQDAMIYLGGESQEMYTLLVLCPACTDAVYSHVLTNVVGAAVANQRLASRTVGSNPFLGIDRAGLEAITPAIIEAFED